MNDKKNVIIWEIYESDLYQNDSDFIDDYCRDKLPKGWESYQGILQATGVDQRSIDLEKIRSGLSESDLEDIEELKDEYYNGDFWADSDGIRIPTGEGLCTYSFRKIGNEIIMGYSGDDSENADLIEKVLLHYFSDSWNDKSTSPEFDRGDWFAKLQNGSDADIWIKYRGGSGYTYAFCGYNSKDFK